MTIGDLIVNTGDRVATDLSYYRQIAEEAWDVCSTLFNNTIKGANHTHHSYLLASGVVISGGLLLAGAALYKAKTVVKDDLYGRKLAVANMKKWTYRAVAVGFLGISCFEASSRLMSLADQGANLD